MLPIDDVLRSDAREFLVTEVGEEPVLQIATGLGDVLGRLLVSGGILLFQIEAFPGYPPVGGKLSERVSTVGWYVSALKVLECPRPSWARGCLTSTNCRGVVSYLITELYVVGVEVSFALPLLCCWWDICEDCMVLFRGPCDSSCNLRLDLRSTIRDPGSNHPAKVNYFRCWQ